MRGQYFKILEQISTRSLEASTQAWDFRGSPPASFQANAEWAIATHTSFPFNSSSSSALQLFVSFGLLNYFFPFLSLLRRLFPIIHSHLPQVIPHIVLPPYFWPSRRSCCVRFPFVYCLGHSFVGHSFYIPQPAQTFVFYVSYYIFVINCFFQFFICFESPLSENNKLLYCIALYCIVLTARIATLSFFQNPAHDRESNPHEILIRI